VRELRGTSILERQSLQPASSGNNSSGPRDEAKTLADVLEERQAHRILLLFIGRQQPVDQKGQRQQVEQSGMFKPVHDAFAG
jgi:hypothetical protein